MTDLICPFSATLAKNDFACPYADQIIRRGGAEFACRQDDRHTDCSRLHDRLRHTALPVFELEDDLLQVPHGILAKIQFGGLLGLQRLLGGDADSPVSDISALVQQAIMHYGDTDTIPCEQLIEDITGYRLARRRRR